VPWAAPAWWGGGPLIAFAEMGAQPKSGSFTVSATEDEPEGEMSPALVQARDLFKIYREGSVETVALRSASLELPRGQITSLVGPSGSGKSTLLSILAGLALPSAGQVLFDAEDITRLDEAGRARLRARRIGMVQQSGNLIPFLSALENVKLALTLAGGATPSGGARALLGELGLAARLHHLPKQLSGGEAQRVSIAVALANQPDLLLADELTGELDSATAEQVMELILEAWRQRGLTVLLVTHNPGLAERAQRRLRLIDGTVTEL
jgi:putative ABC transport system ATP-binding protein